jgi:hypothetical protein
MQIADGRKTVEESKAETAKRVMKHSQSSPLANGENEPPDEPDADEGDDGQTVFSVSRLPRAVLYPDGIGLTRIPA